MNKLAHYREQMHFTQEELASKSGISVRTIQRIEAGAIPKGHSLKTLAQALQISNEELLGESKPEFNFQLIKLINISSLPFVVIPLANIAVPLLIMYGKKEVNTLTKQIVSLQIFWTIIATVVFLLSPFIGKLFSTENKLTLWVLIISIVINILVILINTASLDKKKALSIRLNFSFL